MTAPVTGPFSVSWTHYGPPNDAGQLPGWTLGTRTWSRQKRPYTIELPFSYGCTRITSSNGGNGLELAQAHSHPSTHVSESMKDRLYAQAYGKFASKLQNDAAELGATLATWRQSHDMILDRSMRLRLGFHAVTTGDNRWLKSLWGKHAGIRGNAIKLGSNILEACFGWAPLVSDIANAVKKLGGDLYSPKVRVRIKMPYTFNSGWTSYSTADERFIGGGTLECSLRARVRIINPNSALLNQLGLTNPATVLWEVVPWSFVVDYFVNVQEFLQSFTDMIGIELEGDSHTFFITESGIMQRRWTISPPPDFSPFHYTWKRVEAARIPGIPRPPLVWKMPWQMSVQRGATSIGLLLQRLKYAKI